MAKKSKTKKRPPELDPVLPLPAGTGVPEVRQGEGGDLLNQTDPVMFPELTQRAFRNLWEIVEAKARVDYPKYLNGPMHNVAMMRLEQVTAFRSAAAGVVITPMDEAKAQKARRILSKIKAEEAAAEKAKKKAKKGAVEETEEERHEREDAAMEKSMKKRCPVEYKGERCKLKAEHWIENTASVHVSKSYKFKQVGNTIKGKKR